MYIEYNNWHPVICFRLSQEIWNPQVFYRRKYMTSQHKCPSRKSSNTKTPSSHIIFFPTYLNIFNISECLLPYNLYTILKYCRKSKITVLIIYKKKFLLPSPFVVLISGCFAGLLSVDYV